MADVIERMEKMEAYIKVLNEEKTDSKMQIKLLETRLEKSEKRIQELEQRQEMPSDEVKCGFKKSEFKKMEKRLSELETKQQELKEQMEQEKLRREEVKCDFKKEEFKKMKRRLSNVMREQQNLQEQAQDASHKFEKIDKLQLLLNNIVLKKQLADPRDLEDKQILKPMAAIKSYQDTMHQTAFMVNLQQVTALTTGVYSRLDIVGSVYGLASPYFDEENAFFIVPVDGIYLFNVSMQQKGYGHMAVTIGMDDGDKYQVAQTFISSHWNSVASDSRSGSHVLRLMKGQRIGVYLFRFDGQAKMGWCLISGCLVS